MKLWHCKKCGTFIGHYGCDELCPTCRRKEKYLTKEEVITMFVELKKEIEEKRIDGSFYGEAILNCAELIQQKINSLKENT